MKKIGIALSGGGFRATVFHLGVLARVAETDMWDGLTHVSTVSGGTLCVAMIYQTAAEKWPTSVVYRKDCLPAIYEELTSRNLQMRYFWSIVLKPWRVLQGRAHVIAALLEKHWGLKGKVKDMPEANPRWSINATCYETGKNWRFTSRRMGDYVANYVMKPDFPLSDAVATSAAVPGVIGPLKVKTKKYSWKKYNDESELEDTSALFKTLTLWDGGVYDNLGVEALYKTGEGLRKDVEFLLVSDASKPLEVVDRKWFKKIALPKSPMRLVNIPMDQVRSVRSRDMYNFFADNKAGGYMRMGYTVRELFDKEGVDYSEELMGRCLGEKEVKAASSLATTLRRLSAEEFGLLFRHGYEICSAVLTITESDEYMPFGVQDFDWLPK